MAFIYIIKSQNTDKYYIDHSTYSYASLILHKHINSYKLYIKNKIHFKSVYNIIDLNNVYIEILEKLDECDENIINDKINDYILNNPNIIDNTENINNNLDEIIIYKNKKTKEDKKEYLKKYYEDTKDENKDKLKEYYKNNKTEIKRKSRRYYKSIKDKQTISKDITEYFNENID
jgi:hypothetical protein